MLETIFEELKEIAGADNVRADEPMDIHTTFRAGGRAAFYVEAENAAVLSGVMRYIGRKNKEGNKLPYFILGNGSNVLVKDTGYEGIVIRQGGSFGSLRICGEPDGCCRLEAGAAAMLSRASKLAAENGCTGMETLAGIPGSIGGAVAMNAGAYGGEIRDVIESAEVMDSDGRMFVLTREELDLSYRHSIIQDNGYIVLKAVFRLAHGDREAIDLRMRECAVSRREKQPLEYPSAGSTFKRPEGYFAGKLIMDAGLRGYRYGGAMVSEKHCGFVINENNATAGDILHVIEDVQAEVKRQFGIELETEVKILG